MLRHLVLLVKLVISALISEQVLKNNAHQELINQILHKLFVMKHLQGTMHPLLLFHLLKHALQENTHRMLIKLLA